MSRWTSIALTCAAFSPAVVMMAVPQTREKALVAADGANRLRRTVTCTALVQFDYRYNLRGLDRDSEEFKKKRSEIHLRSAERLLGLCRAHGGTYVKLGQLIASMDHALPAEYTRTFTQLQDQAKPSPINDVNHVLLTDFWGRSAHDMFAEFDEEPIAVASLAQVHRARAWDGEELAVKVQHRVLEQQVASDLFAMECVGRVIEAINTDVKVMWIAPILKENLDKELDFSLEAQNMHESARNFAKNRSIHIPHIRPDMCSKRVITMEYIHGVKISDATAIEKMGLNPRDVGRLAVNAWSQMVFLHKFVHVDPHPGNIFVRAIPPPRTWLSPLYHQLSKTRHFSCLAPRPSAELVILDHGQYRRVGGEFSDAYAHLWIGLVLRDKELLKIAAEGLGIPQFAQWLPLIFTYRSHESDAKAGEAMSMEERQALRAQMRELGWEGALLLLSEMPDDMLFVMRTNALLRSTCRSLGLSSFTRFFANATTALESLTTDTWDNVWSVWRVRANLWLVRVRMWVGDVRKNGRDQLQIG